MTDLITTFAVIAATVLSVAAVREAARYDRDFLTFLAYGVLAAAIFAAVLAPVIGSA